ncbi:hypothetical protein [Chitinimonas sp. JJ19]|uniref:hypothetical protein n=1 Tax=Chitinimonas sp. JJ19 TaxID=3109352 RepID=UPI0030033FE4
MSPDQQATLAALIGSLPTQWVAGYPLVLDEGGVVGRFFKCELRSHFSRIEVGGAHLARADLQVRGPDGEPFPAGKLFTLAAGEDGLLKLDRLCRLIHALNHFKVAGRRDPLVIAIHPRLFDYVKTAHGRTFARMLSHFDLTPAGIVLELPPDLPQATLDGYLGEGFTLHFSRLS